MHKSITTKRVLAAAKRAMTSLANPGFCIKCGMAVGGVEPDARRYECPHCHAKAVYGAEELLMHMSPV